MKNHLFVIGVAVAFSFWVIESVLHYHLFDKGQTFEWLPNDANELWMRSLIFMLIVLFAGYAQRTVNHTRQRDNEKLRVLKATMYTVHDVVNNFLNNLHLIRCEADEEGEWSAQTLKRFDALIQETSRKIKEIGDLNEITERDLGDGQTALVVKPRNENEI